MTDNTSSQENTETSTKTSAGKKPAAGARKTTTTKKAATAKTTSATTKASSAAKTKAGTKPAPATATKTTRRKKPAAEKTEAEKAAEAAQKEAQRLAKEAEKERKKAEEQARKERNRAEAEKSLEGDAKEINVRFEKADKYLQQADDHRLAASLKLSEAKDKCSNNGISFKDWCENNITQSYETARKLIPVGNAEREEKGKGALLLEDMRKGNAEAMRKKRAEAKKAKSSGGEAASKEPRKAPGERAASAVKEMQKSERTNFLRSQAEASGMHLLTEEEYKRVPGKNMSLLQVAERSFENLSSRIKREFLEWAAGEFGATITFPEEAKSSVEVDEDGEPVLPEALRRRK